MNQDILNQKLQALAAFTDTKADSVARFGEILKELGDWDLLRINPLELVIEALGI